MKTNISVTVDMRALLVSKMNTFAVRNKCRLDSGTIHKALTVYKVLDTIAEESFGTVMDVDVNHEAIKVWVTARELAIIGPQVERFRIMLTLVDNIHVKQERGEHVTVMVSMNCKWEKV